MFKKLILFAALAVMCSCASRGDADFIDTSIGVRDNRGSNCVVGPRLPYGSIYPSPQTSGGSMDGYDPASPIRGFAQMHVSGTGWSSYGHFLVSPQIGLSLGEEAHDSPHSQDVTKAFYYSTHLDKYDIGVEIVPSHYCAMYRFTYPESEDSYVALDASQCIMDIAKDMPRGRFAANSAEIDAEGRIRMMLNFEGGWPAEAYDLFLVGEFDQKPSEAGVWSGESVLPGVDAVAIAEDDATHIGAYARFDTSEREKVQLKLAVSFTSFEKAEEFLAAEMSGWDFDRKVDLARDEWNRKLSSIKISTEDETERTLFYSSLFRFYTLASERTADNAKWESDAPFWDDSYAYWDTFRSAYPLMMLIDKPAMRDNLNSMIDRFEHNGAVYDGFIAGAERPSEQGGNDVDHIIAESYLKGIEGVDWDKAYAIVRHNAEERRDGNEGDGFYRELGWIPNCVMSCSQGLEYSYNDYSAYLMAKGLGHAEDAEKYLERSGKWINMWNPDLESDGFRGFIDALNADGSYACIDPKQYGGSWVSPFYEAASWTYSYYVPHDISRLIELMGGPKEYVRRLTYAYENRLIEYTNEPAFLVTRTFSDAGRPDLCSYWTHEIMKNSYDMDGYPGNEDTGAMGSWYVLSAIGLFPNAGQDYYYLNAPKYTESVLDLGDGKKLTIRSDAAPGKVYIKSCKIGGVEWNKATVTHEELVDAGLIEMALSDTPTDWACRNTFDPMFDDQCHVQQKVKGDEWPGAYMWHPGQLAAWLQADNLARSKGRCVNVGYPGSYYKRSESTLFQANTDLNKASVLEWRSTGEVQLSLDGEAQVCKGNRFKIPAGKHILQIQVTSQSRVPALIVKGAGLEDAICWTASTDGENWSPVESDSRYCCPESFPDEAQEVLVTIPYEGKIKLKDGEQRLIDFKYLELGYVRMHVKGKARLAFSVGETAEEARNTVIGDFEQYALDTLSIDGEQDVSLEERALRYLNITAVDGACTISGLHIDAELWPVDPEMDFECDDEELNDIFNAAKATMHTCMHNFYLDGVKRDFLPWALDAILSSIGADFAFGDRQMSRNGISIALLPDHPSKEDIGVCDYPLHALIGLQQEYLRYGDLNTSLMFQKRIIDQMNVYMSLQDEKGFISSSDESWGFIPGWNLQNGPERIGTPAYAQMILLENFRIAARFAKLWGMPELAEMYTERGDFLEKNIKNCFWDPQRRVFINGLRLDGSRDERISHHSQYWAVLAGLYPETEYKHLFEEVYPSIPDYFGDVSFEKGYEAIAFAKAGYTSEFIDIMKEIFGVWLEKGHTRFPENFMVGESEAKQLEFYDRPFGLSLCHGANGVAPVCTVVYGLFGFRQDMEHPGEYTVSPKLSGLKYMKGYFPVKEGRVTIQVTEDGTVQVDAPDNCSVRVL